MSDPRAHARDFWGRRVHEPRHARDLEIVGRVVTVATDRPEVLDAVDLAADSYSVAPRGTSSYRIELICPSGTDRPTEALPTDLFDLVTYAGHADWLALDLGAFGHAQVDLARGCARAVLLPALWQRPDEVARCVLHTVATNFLLRDGVGMLHAAALVREGPSGPELLLLVGADGAGKSTMALRLVLAGWSLLSESSVYVEALEEGLRFSGFPVGIARLRRDMVHAAGSFPVREERRRGETKYRVDLRGHPGAVWPEAVVPDRVVVALLSARGRPGAPLTEAVGSDVVAALARDSIFWDRREIWDLNEEMLDRLARAAEVVRLPPGADHEAAIAAVDGAGR